MFSPLEGMSEENAILYLKRKGEEFGQIFEDSFRKLQEQILCVEPLHLLSSLSFYNLTSLAKKTERIGGEKPIHQHAIELVQALVLQHAREDFTFNPKIAFDSQVLRDLIRKAPETFQTRRLTQLDPTMSSGDRVRLKILEFIRMHTQVIRNWGYPQQITRIVKDLFAPLEAEIEQWRGVRVSYLIDTFIKVARVIASRINSHNDLVRPALRARSINSAVKKYYQSFTDLEGGPENFLAIAKEHRLTLERVKYLLMSHSGLRLANIYTLSLDDFLKNYPVSVEPGALRQVLDAWSLSLGGLAGRNPEHFFLQNPIWRQPLIKLKEDEYFWPITGVFISFCLELMEDLVTSNAEIQSKYEKLRAKYLEDEVERLFASAFPAAKTYRGSLWRDPSTQKDFENDLLIHLDPYIILVESKSGKVHATARRGADLRLGHTIRELIIEPSIQAQRFADYLTSERKVHRFTTKSGNINEVDTSNVHEVVRINVNLDLLGVLMSRWPELSEAGFVPQGARLSPTISLADLELIFTLLDGTCEKLHYLIRRFQFEETAICLGDEPDLLAFYLNTGFNIGEAEFNGTPLILWGMSQLLDPYFMREWWGGNSPKPRRKLTTWWRDLLDKIEERRIPRWPELGYVLLCLAYDGQMAFEKRFKRMQKKLLATRNIKGEGFITLVNGPAQRRDVIIGLAYRGLSSVERHSRMQALAIGTMDEIKTTRALVIGKDVEDRKHPYSVIGCLLKDLRPS